MGEAEDDFCLLDRMGTLNGCDIEMSQLLWASRAAMMRRLRCSSDRVWVSWSLPLGLDRQKKHWFFKGGPPYCLKYAVVDDLSRSQSRKPCVCKRKVTDLDDVQTWISQDSRLFPSCSTTVAGKGVSDERPDSTSHVKILLLIQSLPQPSQMTYHILSRSTPQSL